MSKKPIPVVILCGGMGTRLKEETEFKPKPMVLIGEKPTLWHIMKIYAHYGFSNFIIALGYKGEMIKEYFLNQDYFMHDFTLNTKTGKKRVYREKRTHYDNFHITFVDTGLETFTGERILLVKDYIDRNQFMVTYGDGVGDIDIQRLVAFHNQKKKHDGIIATITGVNPRSRWGLARANKNNLVTSFQQKPVLSGQVVNGGFMVCEKEFFDYLRQGEMFEGALERLTKRRKLALYTHSGFWFGMDTYRDVVDLNHIWQTDPKWKVWKD